jgi:hypothetical protein
VTRRLDVALAWVLLAAFGALARCRTRFTRSLILLALRRASRPERRETGGRGTEELLSAFERASRANRVARSCLPRALALHRLLALRGRPARVRLGLRLDRGPHEGHAWVECDGVPVGEAPASLTRYLPCETS